jgi:hypothetical protein
MEPMPQPGRIAGKLGCQSETLRRWIRQAERDTGQRAGLTDERQRLKQLERGNLELKRANEILKTASAYFAQALLDRRAKSWSRISMPIEIASGSKVTFRPRPCFVFQTEKPINLRPSSGPSAKWISASASFPGGLPRSFGVILTDRRRRSGG